MKKALRFNRANPFAGLIVAFFFILAVGIFALLRIPHSVEQRVKSFTKSAGFEPSTISEPNEQNIVSARYENLKLDKENFSTLQTLTIDYSPTSILLGGPLKKLELDKLSLTGEINEQGALIISGWNTPSTPNMFLNQLLNTQNISLKDTSISLLSASDGGISLKIDAQAKKIGENLDFDGTLSNTQKHLRYNAKINGTLSKDLAWNSTVEIQDLKLNTEKMTAARANGTLTIAQTANEPAQINGEISAGNIKVLNLPWTNASISLHGHAANPSAVIAAKATGYEQTELGLAIDNINHPDDISGYIYARNMGQFFDFLNQHKLLPTSREILATLNDVEGSEILLKTIHKDALELTFRNQILGIEHDAFMQLKYNKDKPYITGLAVKSKSRGTIKVNAGKNFPTITASSINKARLKKSLKNFSYSKFFLKARQLLEPAKRGLYLFEIELTGTAPNLKGAQVVTFTIEAKPEDFIRALVQ